MLKRPTDENMVKSLHEEKRTQNVQRKKYWKKTSKTFLQKKSAPKTLGKKHQTLMCRIYSHNKINLTHKCSYQFIAIKLQRRKHPIVMS